MKPSFGSDRRRRGIVFSLALVGAAVQAASCATSDGSDLGGGGSPSEFLDSGGPSTPNDAGIPQSTAADTGAPNFDPQTTTPTPRDAAVDDACIANLTGRIRDFTTTHPDFESYSHDDRGIVEKQLGADRKPVYAHVGGRSPTTTNKTAFDQWYRDSDGVNIGFPFTINPTVDDAGVATFSDDFFFPIDGVGYNDQQIGEDQKYHNFWFTFELHTTFEYAGNERFTFKGDDDVWVFINNSLVVDLGGIHPSEEATVDLKASAAALGLSVGVTYPLDIFQAERHTSGSHFRMDTSIHFNNCSPVIILK